MNGARLANSLWLASAVPDALRFRGALGAPAEAQGAMLRDMLRRHAGSVFGRAHHFHAIANEREFARHVPVSDYGAFAPWIDRVRHGERDVLACGDVSHLAPTSGTSAGRKLIPFTARLQRCFARSVNAWLADLVRLRPSLLGGPAYWSVSPSLDEELGAPGRVRIGFDDDAEYLGGPMAWLVRHALAVPSSVRHARDESAFWRLTLVALLRRRNLRMISIWHPSFMELLVAEAGKAWGELLDAIRSGVVSWSDQLPATSRPAWRASPDRARADELRRLGPDAWTEWWPRLEVLSCWGDQAAAAGCQQLRSALPNALVQAKGLLATEAVVTVPIGDRFPLATTSHYFEFIGADGDVRRAHELERGSEYEIVVTNGGGLWRYRLGDMVECTGHLLATPTLRFLGRAGVVSDLRGEKLADAFVAESLRALWGASAPMLSELHAWEDGEAAGYTLRVSDDIRTDQTAEIVKRCEALLAANPHYAVARRLGQLAPLRVTVVPTAECASELQRRPGRLGDAKPRALVCSAPGPARGAHAIAL